MLLSMWPKHSVKLLSRFSRNTPKLSCARKPILSLSLSLSLLHRFSAFPPYVAPRLSCTSYCISFSGKAVILATMLTSLSSKVSSCGVDSVCGLDGKNFKSTCWELELCWGRRRGGQCPINPEATPFSCTRACSHQAGHNLWIQGH